MNEEKTNLSDDYVTVGEAAGLLHVSKQTILNMILRGELSTLTTPGGHNRVPKAEIDEYIEANFRQSAGKGGE